jgi:hypothetical protein
VQPVRPQPQEPVLQAWQPARQQRQWAREQV